MHLNQFTQNVITTAYSFRASYLKEHQAKPEHWPLEIPEDNTGAFWEMFQDHPEPVVSSVDSIDVDFSVLSSDSIEEFIGANLKACCVECAEWAKSGTLCHGIIRKIAKFESGDCMPNQLMSVQSRVMSQALNYATATL